MESKVKSKKEKWGRAQSFSWYFVCVSELPMMRMFLLCAMHISFHCIAGFFSTLTLFFSLSFSLILFRLFFMKMSVRPFSIISSSIWLYLCHIIPLLFFYSVYFKCFLFKRINAVVLKYEICSLRNLKTFTTQCEIREYYLYVRMRCVWVYIYVYDFCFCFATPNAKCHPPY